MKLRATGILGSRMNSTNIGNLWTSLDQVFGKKYDMLSIAQPKPRAVCPLTIRVDGNMLLSFLRSLHPD